MGLREYFKKRDFTKTREPRGKIARAGKSLKFFVQEHHASHLHYDFRLEMEGVLKSWAVPKGPSLDPSQKRLAVQVEDHPLAYGNFSGRIPKGEYGAGTVKVWDKGEWIPTSEDPTEDLEKGSLKFELKGKKLKGRWKLFRMNKAGQKNWLLMKAKDEVGSGVARPRRRAKAQASLAKLKDLSLTHPDKIYYPDLGLKKVDLLGYYLKASEKILEHIADRPLMLVRCPSGVGESCFHQKHWTSAFPAAIKKLKVRKEPESFFKIDSVEGLIALAQMGTLEIHMWNTHFDHLESPDQWVIDLDPGDGVPWEKVSATALLMRKKFTQLGLKSFAKTTGGKGLHVVVPIEPKLDWKMGADFAKAFCEDIRQSNPSLYLLNMSKAKRSKMIYLDYLRNTRGATAIAPYSPRARPTAAISCPLSWKEIEDGIRSDSVNLENFEDYLSKNPWKDFYTTKQFPTLRGNASAKRK